MDINVVNSKIAVIDDSVVMVKRMAKFLKEEGYQVYTAYDGKQGLELIYDVRPNLVIIDLYMPHLTGIEVCRIIKNDDRTRFIPVIMITSSEEKNDKNLALGAGVNDYLDKTSFDLFELKLKVQSLLKLKNAIDQLENANNIILALSKATEVKDKYTVGHAERVSLYATKIGKFMELSDAQIRDLTMAGLLHDIGKIGIPDNILNKPGKLDDDEFNIIKTHPVIGEDICNPIKSFDNVKRIIRHHHEKLNGRGYPDGISGDEINIETRIMTVADIYDALTSNRSYRGAMQKGEAFSILRDSIVKGELDSIVVDAFDRIMEY